MKLNPVQATVVAAACALVGVNAHAQATSWDPSWSFSGFGTAAYVQTNTDLGLLAGPGQPGGASNNGTFGVDSKIGAQLSGKANAVFSGTVQVLSQRNGDGNFKPSVDWAFAKAQVTPELAVRIGRIGSPLFAVSDFRNVGYSNLWVRPPLDVYGQVSFSHFDGADAIYQASVGGAALTAQVLYGNTDTVNGGSPVHVRHQTGLNLTAEFDDGITLRVGRVQGKLSVDNAALTHLVTVIGSTPFAAVGDEISATDKSASFTGIGVALDHDNWVGGVEYTKRKTSSYVSSTTGWAATGGYRIGKFTPFAVVSRLKVDSSNVDNTIPGSVPQLAPLSAAVNGLIANQEVSQKTTSAGLRWDAWRNIDVKAQYDRVTPDGDRGLFNNVKPGFGSTAVNVYSVAVDFVF
jgi:hypothetical protein